MACGRENLTKILTLGDQPLANSFLQEPRKLPTQELAINFCHNCSHSQLTCAVAPELLYSDYKYVSGTTDTLKKHFKSLAFACDHYTDEPAKRVLDIGCNDGTLLEAFRLEGYEVEGVDPASNLREISEAKDIPVLVDFWSEETAFKMSGEFTVITALNCLAHNSDPYGFLKGCLRVLAPEGAIVIEFPYFLSTIENNDLGQFYAEHHSYFAAESFVKLIERLGLVVHRTTLFPEIHGGTVRFVLRRGNFNHCQEFREMYLKEQEANIWRSLHAMKVRLEKQTSELYLKLGTFFNEKKTIVAYGASAKSSTLFNLPSMKNAKDFIKYVVDDSPMKQDLYCPGSNLPVLKTSTLTHENKEDLVILMTVHNFKKEIMNRLCDLGLEGVTILNYTPTISVESCTRS